MKNWNRTGKIKAIVLTVLFFLNLFAVSPQLFKIGLFQYLVIFLFGALALPLIIRVNVGIGNGIIEKPNWNENPFRRNRPLVFFQFAAWFMLFSGASMLIGSIIKHQVYSSFGMSAFLFGAGALIGIQLTLKWFR